MTADVKVSDNQDHQPNCLTSPLTRRYSECTDDEEDVWQLAQDCMCHECNRYFLRSTKAGTPQKCRSHYGTKTKFGKLDTPGMDQIEKARICRDIKGILHFTIRRTQSVRLVQHSRSLLQGRRANCDITMLLYYSNSSCSDISGI